MTGHKRLDFAGLSGEILARENRLRFRARGGSMYPFVRDGDILEVEPVDASAIRVGDVIFFLTALGRALAHRVIKKRAEKDEVMLVTKGDQASASDQPISAKDVLGRVTSIEREGRNIRFDRGLTRWMGVLYAGVSPFSPLIYSFIRSAKRMMGF